MLVVEGMLYFQRRPFSRNDLRISDQTGARLYGRKAAMNLIIDHALYATTVLRQESKSEVHEKDRS